MPLESTASAAAAQARSIQRRSAADFTALSCASVKANTAQLSHKVKPASSRFNCPTPPKNGLSASATRLARPASKPYRRRTQANTSGRQAKARPADHKRELHSLTPATEYTAAVAQYCNGGFSKYLRPSN